MNYFDKILIKDLNDGEIHFNILSEKENASIVRDINKTISFSGSKINWEKLKDGMYFGDEPSAQVIFRLAVQIRKVTDGNLIFIGDSAYDNVYSINPEHLEKALRIFSDLPQHTYITSKSLTWIACMSSEGDVNFASIYEDTDN